MKKSKRNYSVYPCPICKKNMWVIGKDEKGNSVSSCGHSWSFKKSRSQKELERKYIRTEWGLELVND
jgi:hypothetical protein